MKQINIDGIIGRNFCYVWLFIALAATTAAFLQQAWHHLITAGLSFLLYYLFKKYGPIHIPPEVYNEMNEKILFATSEISESGTKNMCIETEFGDKYAYLLVSITTTVDKFKSPDEAWGSLLFVTERNISSVVEILAVNVLDKYNKRYDSDFDKEKITREYESTEWM